MRKILLAAPLALLAVACSTGSDDYKSQTEDYLNDSSDVEELFGGADVSDAACEEPTDTDVGTQYTCVAEVADTGSVDFVAEIDAENSYFIAVAP